MHRGSWVRLQVNCRASWLQFIIVPLSAPGLFLQESASQCQVTFLSTTQGIVRQLGQLHWGGGQAESKPECWSHPLVHSVGALSPSLPFKTLQRPTKQNKQTSLVVATAAGWPHAWSNNLPKAPGYIFDQLSGGRTVLENVIPDMPTSQQHRSRWIYMFLWRQAAIGILAVTSRLLY